MKITDINQKLKNKIILVELPQKKEDINEEEDGNVEVKQMNSSNNVAFVQMNPKWMKFVLKGSSNTYLLEFDKIAKLQMQKIQRSVGVDPSAFKNAAEDQSKNLEKQVHVGIVADIDMEETRRKVLESSDRISRILSNFAQMFNSSNSYLIPGYSQEEFVKLLNSPLDIDGRYVDDQKSYVVVANGKPFAFATRGILTRDAIEFNKVLDPLIWLGTLLQGEEGNIDDPTTPLGITA